MYLTVAANTLGYLGLFLFGLQVMSHNLSQMTGSTIKNLLGKLARTPLRSFLTGCLATIFLQSSSLISVIAVGLVNAHMLNLAQATGIIIGANLGTTGTAQLLAFNLRQAALPLIGLAALLSIIPWPPLRSSGRSLLGFGIVLLGLEGMTHSLAPLKEMEIIVSSLISDGEAPIKGLSAGFLATAILQSSSAVMGLVLGLASEGMINLPAALAIMIGADLGTSTTALLASLGMSRVARAAAWSHFFFNLISLILVLPFFSSLVLLAEYSSPVLLRRIANAHSIYNLLGALVMLPLVKPATQLWERRFAHCSIKK